MADRRQVIQRLAQWWHKQRRRRIGADAPSHAPTWGGLEALESRVLLSATSDLGGDGFVASSNNGATEPPFEINLISPFVLALEGPAEIDVLGLGDVVITDGDTTPDPADGTNFGSVAKDNTSVLTRTFTILNTGGATLNLSGTPRVLIGGSQASEFTVTQMPAASIAAGESTTFTIEFKPGAVGVRNAVVVIESDDADEDPYEFSITGEGVAPAEIDLRGLNNTAIADGDTTPSATDGTIFGSALVGGMITRTFTINNTGGLPLNLTGTPAVVSISGTHATDFTVTTLPASSVAAAGSTTFVITFTPSALGTRNATVTIANNDGDENPYNFNISGTGAAPAEMDVRGLSNTPITDGDVTPSLTDGTDFGDVITSLTRTFTIANSGGVPLNITGTPRVVIGGADAAFFNVLVQPAATVAAAGTTTFTVTFTASALGERTATISIANDDANENPYEFTIKANGVDAPDIDVRGLNNIAIADGDNSPGNSDGTDFGGILLNGTTVTRTFTIHNVGNLPLTLTGTPRVTITGAHFADFNVTVQPGSSIAAGASTTFEVTFTPSALGTRTATITIASDDPNEAPFDFAIRGQAVTPAEIDVRGLNNTPIIDGDDNPSAIDGTNFGSAILTATGITRTFTIRNAGGQPLNLTGTPLVTITGAHAANFSVTVLPSATVAAGQSTTFAITFTPSALGSRHAVVAIASNDSNESPYEFSITGEGIDAPDIEVRGPAPSNSVILDGDNAPTTGKGSDFGNIILGQTGVSRIFTIQNKGNAPLNLTGANVVISGAHAGDFTITDMPEGPIAPGATATFQVTFNPSKLDSRNAIVTVLSNDPDEASYEFAVTGRGIISSTTLVNGLKIDLVTEGRGREIGAGTHVRVNYVLRIASTGQLNQTGTFDFTTDSGGVILGFNQGVLGMTRGEKRVLFLPAAIAYGNNPPAGIPANADLIFEVEVVKILGEVKAEVRGPSNRKVKNGDMTPDTRNGATFPETAPNVSVTQAFIVQNRGVRGSNLVLTGTPKVAFSGDNAADFTLQGTQTLADGSTLVTIRFTPTTTGTKNAVVTFASNDPDQSPYTFAITGTAKAAGVSINNANVTEGNSDTANMQFTVTLSQAMDVPVSVDWKTVRGSASQGSDYIGDRGKIIFAPGETTKTIEVAVRGDTQIEPNETFTVELSKPSDEIAITDASGTGTITTDESPNLTIVAMRPEGTERGRSLMFRIYRNGPAVGNLTATYTISGSAVNGTDYTSRGAALPTSVTLFGGSPYYDIIIDASQDNLAEGDETIVLTLVDTAAYDLSPDEATRSATATIADNAPVVSVVARDAAASETNPTSRAGMGVFRIQRTGNTSGPTTVNYTLTGTAANGADYISIGGSVVIPARKRFVDILVVPINDEVIAEGMENVILTLSTGTGYHLTPQMPLRSAAIDIADND